MKAYAYSDAISTATFSELCEPEILPTLLQRFNSICLVTVAFNNLQKNFLSHILAKIIFMLLYCHPTQATLHVKRSLTILMHNFSFKRYLNYEHVKSQTLFACFICYSYYFVYIVLLQSNWAVHVRRVFIK